MNKCPICNKEFKSLRGMRSHHKSVHGKSLLEITCEICGKAFPNYEGDRKFCSRECAGQHFSIIYNQNATATCVTCNKIFSIRPNKLKQDNNFCSRACWQLWIRRNQRPLNCEICGVEIVNEHYYKEQRFCSKACEAKWKSLAYKGKSKGKLITYLCNLCGKEFQDFSYSGERKFCSKKCAAEALKDRTLKQCKKCGKTFEVSPWNTNRTYCSWQCFRSDKGETEPERLFREFLESHQVPFVQEWRIPNSHFHADFFLHELSLIVEIDGSYWHSLEGKPEQDALKDIFCSNMGLGVLRLDATDLQKHFERRKP